MGRATFEGEVEDFRKGRKFNEIRSVAVVETVSSCENVHEECPKMREMKQIVSVEVTERGGGKPKEVGKLDNTMGCEAELSGQKRELCSRTQGRSGRPVLKIRHFMG